ncbi:cytosol aminopeptidase family, catalytic domain protein [Oesophagostomum dentatum]|uniref:Cytosol aminopeptidase family, catalytic domain protein n=1 Tax=Oesophagostomum dentatum TaxID=61180 RepID=A0A0B1TS56_OESDE|nr:cytosol aminopeptidase family, catalytic domain protein [Oesophagostomum dentatum]
MMALVGRLKTSIKLPEYGLVIAGQHSLLKALSFEKLAAKFNGEIDEKIWRAALSALPTSGSIPLYLNRSRIISLPDTWSRHNAPSNCHVLTKELRAFPITAENQKLDIILVCEKSNVFAEVAAVTRAFPIYTKKSEPPPELNLVIELCLPEGEELDEHDRKLIEDVALSIRETCRMVDTPSNELTTDAFVKEILEFGKILGSTSTVVSGEALEKEGFGGIWSVGRAGPNSPYFVVLKHEPENATKSYCMAGKGVVFDTGGMQIKGKTGMPGMKRDMGGAAAMLGAFYCLVRAGFKEKLYLCLAVVENSIANFANKPDDVITMLSGKTVEITNTDAEGRLILADAVYFAKHTLKADVIVDMATLTGAQSYLSGKYHAALLTNCDEWEQKVREAGRLSGDLVAPMVFCPDLHFSDLKSPVADMRNSNLGKMEGPPSAIAGLFIGAHIDFGEGIKWMHLDIASPAECGERATGYGTALLTYLFGHLTEAPMFSTGGSKSDTS